MSDAFAAEVVKQLKESAARKLISHVAMRFDLIHYEGESYAVRNGRTTLPFDPPSPADSREAMSIKGAPFRRYLIRASGRLYSGIRPSELDTATAALDALAFDGPETPLAFRFHYDPGTDALGPNGDWPHVTIDLGREDGQCVIIDALFGWRVGPSPQHIAWRRTHAMKPLPLPDAGNGRIDELAGILALEPDSEAFRAIVGWIVGLPFVQDVRPGLLLVGPPGSGKSTRLRLAASIFEPSEVTALGGSFGHKTDDDQVRALHRAVPLWDNLSNVSGAVSDSLCTIVTGSAREGRTLYSNADLSTYPIKRSVGLTAVSVPAGLRPDALERLIVAEVPAIQERTPDGETQELFNEAHPRLLSAFCDALAIVLRGLRVRRKMRIRGELRDDRRLSAYRMAGHATRLDVLDNADDYTRGYAERRWLPHLETAAGSGRWLPAWDSWPPDDWTAEDAETELSHVGQEVRWQHARIELEPELHPAHTIGVPAGLLDAYTSLGRQSRESTTTEDSFAGAVVALATARGGRWEGTASELLRQAGLMSAGMPGGPGWPSGPRAVVTALRQHQAGLAELGVTWSQSLTKIRGSKRLYLALSDDGPAPACGDFRSNVQR